MKQVGEGQGETVRKDGGGGEVFTWAEGRKGGDRMAEARLQNGWESLADGVSGGGVEACGAGHQVLPCALCPHEPGDEDDQDDVHHQHGRVGQFCTE